jgi:hypothetical protein
MDKKQIIIIVLPIVIGMALFLIISVIDLDLRFTPVEMRVFHYRYDVPELFNLKETFGDTQSVILTALENPFKKNVSVDEKIGIPNPEPILDASRIKTFDPAKLWLSLIIITNGEKNAIINGKILKEGDIIKGFKVKKIEGQKVLLFSNNRSHWIKVHDSNE